MVSKVHRDNRPMCHINEAHFGAVATIDPEDWRREYLIYTITL